MEYCMLIALVVGICVGVAQAVEEPIHIEIADLSHICVGRSEGQLVPNPMDCNAFFACNSLPTLSYCDQGLNFDPINLVCDVPEKAQCTPIESVSAGATTMPNTASGSKPQMGFDWWLGKPRPAFLAVDVETGLAVNPMDKYDPRHMECRHFGAYFLPHPTNCQLYFICAYGHLHRHQCGRGTFWNYKRSECELSEYAECYGNSHNSMEYVDGENTPSSTPGQVTVCYILNTTSTLPNDREPTTSVMAPTPPSAPHSSALRCPSERQSYLPHPEDCSKYYICIAGMPVLTFCPKGLYWDQKAGYCDQAKNVKCLKKL